MKNGYKIPKEEYIDKHALAKLIKEEGFTEGIESVESIYFPMGGDSLFVLHVDNVSIAYSEPEDLLIAVGKDEESTDKSIEMLVKEFREKGILNSRPHS
ncbi:MAG: hypothetical protein PHH54_06895 [Candidatus Nanoarchaeia archaeon]|nr:hypothetical protein [Candidatus Nanoarchaeia archaeon]